MNVQLSFTQQADSTIVPVNAKTKTKIIIKSLKKKKTQKKVSTQLYRMEDNKFRFKNMYFVLLAGFQ